MTGFRAILTKECAHIRRDPGTIFFALVVPALEMMIFGYAIRVSIENIPTVIFDLDGRQESRRLVDSLVAARTFRVVERVHSAGEFRHALAAGRAKAGILIPADYSERLLRREQADIQVLIDGSDSQIATTAQNAAALIVQQLAMQRGRRFGESLQLAPARDPAGRSAMPIEARIRLLHNPDLISAFFFVPGLVVIILQLVLLFLTSFSIVKERENGTLEQLFVTPVSRAGLIFGKLVPYAVLSVGEILIVLTLMTAVFGVPIRGSLPLLAGLSLVFIVTALGLGLFISTLARTQLQSMQLSFLVMLPSVLLSGFVFPRSEMPLPIYLLSFGLPVTYFLEILRGIILRGAELRDLLPHVAGLAICCVVILSLALTRFRKQLD